MIKVSVVSYLNTKPLLYGLVQEGLDKEIDLQLDIPSICAKKLVTEEVDLALIPVAAIPSLKNPHIISDYCIGAEGKVRTVAVFADQPLETLTDIHLDFHSRTSVELLKILLKKYWKLNPNLIHAREGFTNNIKGNTGALVIGDKAIRLEEKHPFIYDLGEVWMQMTKLPFVFAAWVSNRQLNEHFLNRFNQALKIGIEHIPQLLYLLPSPHPNFSLKDYFTQNISYHFDKNKKEALTLFLAELSDKLQSNVFRSLNPV